MRDLVLLVVLGGGMLWALRRPWIGAMLWTWVSLMSPHVAFGYSAASWPVATGVAICTLVGLLFTRERQNPLLGPPMWAVMGLTVWICVTLPFSMYYDESLPLWERSMKIYLMLFVTVALIDEKRKLDVFIWVIVVSIGYYGFKGGLFTLATGGNYRVWGPGGFIGGNNELALAIIVVVPLMRYLQVQSKNRFVRHGLTLGMALSVVTALGTYSRGALLGLGAMGLVFWWRGDRKVLWGVAMLVVGALALSLMPDQWWDRMDTIKTYDADDSALGRLNAWVMAWNLAKANFFGGGFMIYFAPVFARYSPDPERVHAAHSIYFQVLGEHGFVGLALFLMVGATTYLSARKLIRLSRSDPLLAWAGDLGRMLPVSMIGYGVTGAFLSLSYFDLPYNLAAMSAIGVHLVSKRIAASRAVQTRSNNHESDRESL